MYKNYLKSIDIKYNLKLYVDFSYKLQQKYEI